MGLKVHNGRRLDHLLRDTIKGLPTGDRGAFSFTPNHARHAGARIHRLHAEDEDTHRVALRAAFECDIRGLVGMLQALTFGKAALAVRSG